MGDIISFKDRAKKKLSIYVDGPNYSGKTTILNILRQFFPGATIIENHDFFHLHVLRDAKKYPNELYLIEHWKGLSKTLKENALNYCTKRQSLVIKLANSLYLDDSIIERAPLTNWVYSYLLLGKNTTGDLIKTIDLIIPSSILIYVKSEEKDICNRAIESRITRPERNKKDSLDHLINVSLIKEKSNLYDVAYKLVDIENKITINTSLLSIPEMKSLLLDYLSQKLK